MLNDVRLDVIQQSFPCTVVTSDMLIVQNSKIINASQTK